jgi:hypothetical protein
MVGAGRLPVPVEIPGLLVVDDDVVGADVVAALRTGVAATKLTGDSQLGGGFATTRGFGVACRVDAVDEAVARAPFLRPFVDVALSDALAARLLRPGFVERVATALLGSINAAYLNVLVVPPGEGVGRHVDATLGVATQTEAGEAPWSPRLVVVVYVDVPPDLVGGALRLFAGDADAVAAPLAEVVPRAGRLVVFRGGLGHEVTATTSASRGLRVSCVAELYALPPRRLRRLPRVRVQSHGFAAVLARLRKPDPSSAADPASGSG